MRGMPQQQGGGQNTAFMSSVKGFATMVAIIATFLGTPALYGFSVDWVVTYSEQNYMAGIADIVSVIWFGCVGSTLYFIAKMTASTAIVALGIAAAARFAI